MIRLFDIVFASLGLLISLPILFVIYVISFFDTGAPIFFQKRVGKNQKPFTLIKFRTMKQNTVSVASHLVDASAVTSLGSFLRRTKLDELPQLWNVLVGEMSLVGPRPCLLDQFELIEERARRDIFRSRPGITGLAQINDIDMSKPNLLARTDAEMLSELSVKNYFKYIIMTALGKGYGDRIGS